MRPYDWEGRPDGIRLHQRCEAHWFDSSRPAPRLVCARAPIDAAYQATTEKHLDAVADVPDQAEKASPAQPDQPVSAPDPVR